PDVSKRLQYTGETSRSTTMATLAFSIARVARRASARSLQAGGDLILRSYRIAGLHPRSNLTGHSSSNRAIQLFGCAHHGARRPLSTPSFNGVNSEADQQDKFIAEEKDL
ncbi:hypothetical protein PVAP13_1NG046800, partial [Panicum virgatum]